MSYITHISIKLITENNRLACAVLLLSTETAAVLFLCSISTLKRGQLIPTLLFVFMEKTKKVIDFHRKWKQQRE